MIWSAIYISFVLMANYTAMWFIPFPTFGMVSIGTILFGATFTARDHAHRLGKSRIYTMIAIAAISSAVLAIAGSTSFRIVIASVLAIVISESADTEVYQLLLKRTWLLRVAGSNAISVPLDSVIFNLVAFWGVFQFSVLVAIVFGEVIVKFIAGGIFALCRLR